MKQKLWMGELKWREWIEQASFDYGFVSFHSENCAPKLADLTCSCLSEPTIGVLPCARPQHVSDLLDQFIRLIHLSMNAASRTIWWSVAKKSSCKSVTLGRRDSAQYSRAASGSPQHLGNAV